MTLPSPEFFALQQAVAGSYSLERELGRGGMGVVFLARDVALDRPVAIKLLPPELAARPGMRERFLREARTAARLSHPNIVPIHAVEERDGLVFFVMAFVDGETLGDRVRRAGPLPAAEAMRVTQEIAWALGHAHAHGVVHRDVKPDNVLLERGTGRAIVTDFGIARAALGHTAGGAPTPADGTVVGTPAYMSPEQAAGEPVGARSDLYSLGVTAFYAATARLPFEAPSAIAMLARHAAEPAPPLLALRPSLPPAFARVVDRCLAKSPADRPADADDVAAALGGARGAFPEVPAPVAAFVRDADAAGAQLGTALCAALVSFAWMFVVNDFLGIMQAAMLLAATLMLGLVGVRLAQLVQRARGLVRLGYGLEAVRPALALADRMDDAEAAPVPEREARRTTALAVSGAAATALFYWVTTVDTSAWLSVISVVAMIVVPAATLQRLWTAAAAGRRSLWRRLLAGRVGRGIFALARLGQRGAATTPSAGEPTVLALGRAAESLFDALPAADRARLGDVPALLARLQADALALRARGDDPETTGRLATVAAALEAVRLDLLRLHAGAGSLHKLTRDVDAAREIGKRIDVELAARDEVERLLSPDMPTPV
jgi:serine/threonine-protein kinase